MSVVLKNFARTTLAATVGVSDTVITVVDASVFGDLPTAQSYFYAALQHPTSRAIEIVKVTAVSNSQNQLTIVRAQEGTAALPFPDNALCEQRVTAATLEEKFIESQGNQTIEGSLFVKFPYVFGVEGQDGAKYPLLQIDADDGILVGDIDHRLGLAALDGQIWAVGEVGNPSKQWRIFHQGFLPRWDDVTGDEYLDNSVDGETKTARQNLRVGSSITSALLPGADATGDGAWSTIGKQTAWFAEGWFRDLYADNVSINDVPTDDKHAVNKVYLESNAARWKQYARGEAEMNSMREANKALYAASGDINFGKAYASTTADNGTIINEGMWSRAQTDAVNQLFLGRPTANDGSGTSITDFPLKHTAGFVTSLVGMNLNNQHISCAVKFDVAPDGRDTFNKSTGAQVRHATVQEAFAAAAADPNVEVVIDRHDMFGGEFFLEIVSQANPFVYLGGEIQSKATSMNGITTTRSNRPSTYYAQYVGDTTSDGLGVDFWAATPEQKIAMLSDAANNLFILKDEYGVDVLAQWRLRGRTNNGFGNGSWNSLEPSESAPLRWGSVTIQTGVFAQGQKDTIPTGSDFDVYRETSHYQNPNPEVGAFTADDASTAGFLHLCFFVPWGTVRRLNQGAFHPSLNPLGASRWKATDASSSDGLWYEPNRGAGATTAEQAFTPREIGDNNIGRSVWSGSLSSTLSGRDKDGRFYDGVYPSGDGGVNDERVTAWDMGSFEDACKIFNKLVNGTYLGEELFTESFVGSQAYATGVKTYVNRAVVNQKTNETVNLEIGDIVYIQANDGVTYQKRVIRSIQSGQAHFFGSAEVTQNTLMVVTRVSASKVSGRFTMYDLVGKPSDILQVDAVSSGWAGGFIDAIPPTDSSVMAYPFSRKNLDSGSLVYRYTLNQGSSWQSGSNDINNTLNQIATANLNGGVGVFSYTAFAKQTKRASLEKVLGGKSGVGGVWTHNGWYSDKWGNLLIESMLDKVGVNSVTDDLSYMLEITSLSIHRETGLIDNSEGRRSKHPRLRMLAPTNNSPAIKSLWHQTSANQKCGLSFIFNEPVWDGFKTIIQLVSGTTQSLSKGDLCRLPMTLSNEVMRGQLVVVLENSTTTPNDGWYSNNFFDEDGRLVDVSGGVSSLFRKVLDLNYPWGDDATVRASTAIATYVDLNGNSCLMGTHELTKRYGYTKNRSRAGVQVPGVDL